MIVMLLRRRSRRELDADEIARRAVLDPVPTEAASEPVLEHRSERRPLAAGLQALGLPLPDGVRSVLEDRLAVDLSRIRVVPRDDRVRRRGARAEQSGAGIAFAPGQYAPHTAAGLELVAHEVAHALQARTVSPQPVSPKKADSATPFHQSALDRFATAWGREELAMRPVVELLDAVAAERAQRIPILVGGLARVDAHALPPNWPDGAVADELMTRLVLLGQAPAATTFRTWYIALPGIRTPGHRYGQRYYDDEEWHWQEVLERLRARVSWTDATATLRVLDAMSAFFHLLGAEREQLDPKELAADRERVVELYRDLGGVGVGFQTHPYLSIARYESSLLGLQRDAFVGIQAAFQAVLELAAAQLANQSSLTRGQALLAALEQRLGSVLARLDLPPRGSEFEINEWVWRRRIGKDVLRQVDFFPDDKQAAKREITLESYDKDSDALFIGPSKDLQGKRIVEIRSNQVKALRLVYGVEDPAKSTPDEHAQVRENRAVLAAMGSGPQGTGLHLHSDDDWRRFLRAKFEAHLKATNDPDASLRSVIDTLRIYLVAFTTHSPLNIEDLGDDLLRVSFPRALTGQLIHDCGVYALRITYMLSLLRNHPDLRLRFRWIQLPSHIGLVVTGAPGLTTWVVHNDEFTKATAAQMDEYRDTFERTDAKGRQRPPPGPGTRRTGNDALLGELAANEFVEGVDAPFIISDVPGLTGRNAGVDKDRLVAFYRTLMRAQLFGPVTRDPKSPYYQFHLRYLGMLDKQRAHRNTWLVPYWNATAHRAWANNRKALKRADDGRAKATTPPTRAEADRQFAGARAAYLAAAPGAYTVSTGLAKVVAEAKEYLAMAKDINKALADEPQILAKGVSRASAARLAVVLDSGGRPWWQSEIERHLAALAAGTLTEPPFASDDEPLRPVD